MIRRAGGLVSGFGAVLKAIRTGKASLVMISEDSGEVAARRVTRECGIWEVPLIRVGNKADLGRIAGRSAVSVMAITDRPLASAFLAKLGISKPQVPDVGTETDKGEVDV